MTACISLKSKSTVFAIASADAQHAEDVALDKGDSKNFNFEYNN